MTVDSTRALQCPEPGTIPLPSFVLLEANRGITVAGLTGPAPVAILQREDLEREDLWHLILALYPVSMVDLARWWKTTLPEISPFAMMQACGLANHHRSLADWKEMANLDESSASMHRIYDLPLNVLRLWNRLSEKVRSEWTIIFEKHRIKRNLVREIIMDIYDLSPGDQQIITDECLELAENWRGQSSPFPAQQLRDRVHRRRNPNVEELRQKLLTLKRELRTPQEVRIELPADFEGGIEMKAELQSEDAIDRLISFLDSRETRRILMEMKEQL